MAASIMLGTRLGRYEIVALLDAGGMGEVYRARDAELGRTVAIKILPAAFSDHPDRMRRFELEARAAAALNHPNILAVYDVGQHDGTPYLVAELIEGQSLRARLDAGRLPVRTAIEFGIQITEGVAAAHDKGIVHRDLKPENIFVTPDERLKILDFGLAKLVEIDSVTLTALPQTSAGAVLGTVGYLSPEQASGLPADQRSDIFSVGAVLFEMVTHRRAFARATSAQTLAAVLEDDPTAPIPSGPGANTRLMNVVRRCLEKAPERRFQSARDLSFALSEAGHDGDHGPVDRAPRFSRRVIVAVASALVVGAVSGWLGSGLRRRPAVMSSLPSVAFSFTLPRGETFVDGNPVTLSPDGQLIVYGAVRDGVANLYLRKLNQLDPVLLPETSGARQPIFSPDGGSIAFVADRALKVLRLSGGSPITVAPVTRMRGASWGDDDRIVYAPDVEGGLFRVSARGGTPEQLTEVDKALGESSHRFPYVLPGAGALIFMVSDGQRATVSAMDMLSRRRVDGLATGYGPHYLPTGHLVFRNLTGQLSLLPFDASNLRTLGPATALQETADIGYTGEFQGAAAPSGTLAFVPYAPPRLRSFVAIDRQGREQPLAIESKRANNFRVSPDGQWMAMSVAQGPNDSDVWLFNFGRNVWSRLTTDRQSVNPLWTPDGRDIVYGSRRDGYPSVYRQAASPGSTASLIVSVQGAGSAWPSSWLTNGGLFLTVSRGSFDLVLHEPAGRRLRGLVETNANEGGGVVSADGRWVAYASDASGQSEIYVMTIAEPRSTLQVSRGGGVGPVWAKTGNSLYFRRGNQVLATTVNVERGILQSSHEKVVAAGAFSNGAMVEPRFDVMPDGSLIVMKDEPGPPPEIRVIVNWASNALRQTQ